MKRAIYFNQAYNPENPTKYAVCITYDPIDGLKIVDDRNETSLLTTADVQQTNDITILMERIATLEKTVSVLNAGGILDTETEYIANTIPSDGTITAEGKNIEILSYKPASTDVGEIDIVGENITLTNISIPASENKITGSLFDLTSKNSVTIENVSITATSEMTSVFSINAGIENEGAINLAGINLNGSIKTTSTNIFNLDKSNAVEIKDCNFNLSGYNGIMIGQNHKGILPKTIDIENCKFNVDDGKFKMFALNIFATQDDAIVNIKNCEFRNVTSCIRFGNSTAASGVVVNIENCHFANIDLEVEDGGFMSFENFQSVNEYTKAEKIEGESDEEYAARNCLAMLQYDDEVNRFGGGKITINFINCTYGKDDVKPFNFTSNDYIDILGSASINQFAYMINWCYFKKHGNVNTTAAYTTYESTTTDEDGNTIYPQYVISAWGELGRPQNVGPDCWPTINITYNK